MLLSSLRRAATRTRSVKIFESTVPYKRHNPTSCVALLCSSRDNEDDGDNAWIPPSRKVRHRNSNLNDLDDEADEDFEFVPGLKINDDGHIDEFIDLDDLLKNEELLEQLINYNEDNDDAFIDVSEISTAELLIEDEKEVPEIQGDENSVFESNEDLPDWGWARRNRDKGLSSEGTIVNRTHIAEIPVIEQTLLTTKELTEFLSFMGGEDIAVIDISQMTTMADAFVICTCRNPSTMRSIADIICKSMRKRGLHKMGVVGAKKGCEGRDCDDWIVVDCQNIIIHLQDEFTRKHIALEKIWSGPEGKAMSKLKVDNDEELDDYIRENPVPDEYASKLSLETVFQNLQKKNFDLRRSKTTRNQRMRKNRRKS